MSAVWKRKQITSNSHSFSQRKKGKGEKIEKKKILKACHFVANLPVIDTRESNKPLICAPSGDPKKYENFVSN